MRISRRGRALAFAFLACLATVMVVGAGIALTRSQSAAGDVSTVEGGAYGESIDVTTLLGATVVSGPTPSVTLPPGGGGPITDSVANIDVPGVLSLGPVEVSTEGSTGPTGFVKSSAQVAGLNLANGVLTADLIRSECTLPSATPGSTTITNLRLAGTPLASLNPGPNTTLDLPAVGTLILNEQITTPGSSNITVNAVHLKLTNAVIGTGDIILAQSRCQTTGPDVTVPVGAIGGIGLAVVLGGLFVWKMTGWRPRRDARPGTPA